MFLKSLITCHAAKKALTIILICVCGVFYVFSTFTDSYKKGSVTRYGIVTISGNLWPHMEKSDEYRLKRGDLGHALLALMVLGILVLLDSDISNFLYPELISKAFLKWLLELFVKYAPGFPTSPMEPDTITIQIKVRFKLFILLVYVRFIIIITFGSLFD